MMRRRAQAAIEFLTTYSWALFILFGVSAAVYMLDLADPDRYRQTECVLDNQISCIEAQYEIGGSDDDYRMSLRNNYPKAINLTDIYIELQDSSISNSSSLNGTNGYTVGAGNDQIVEHTLPDWGNQGYVSDDVTTTLQYTVTFAPTDSGNKYNKSGYAVIRAQN
jgi:hypothetical protein